MSPCLCGDTFCPSCGGGCVECDKKLCQIMCEHLDYTDTLTGAVCNDCGKEELIE